MKTSPKASRSVHVSGADCHDGVFIETTRPRPENNNDALVQYAGMNDPWNNSNPDMVSHWKRAARKCFPMRSNDLIGNNSPFFSVSTCKTLPMWRKDRRVFEVYFQSIPVIRSQIDFCVCFHPKSGTSIWIRWHLLGMAVEHERRQIRIAQIPDQNVRI